MKSLRVYCHTEESISRPIECCEVSIQASTATLREIATFLNDCADKSDAEHKDKYEHFLCVTNGWAGVRNPPTSLCLRHQRIK